MYNSKRRRQREGLKKTIDLISKKKKPTITTTLHVQYTFLLISLPLFCTTKTWDLLLLFHKILHDHAVRGGVNNFKYIVKAMQTGYDTVVTTSQKKRHLHWKSKTLLLVGAMYCETRAFYNLLFFLLTVDSVACEQQTQFRSSVLSLRKIASANPSGKTISVTWNHRRPRRSICHWMNSNILIFTWTN